MYALLDCVINISIGGAKIMILWDSNSSDFEYICSKRCENERCLKRNFSSNGKFRDLGEKNTIKLSFTFGKKEVLHTTDFFGGSFLFYPDNFLLYFISMLLKLLKFVLLGLTLMSYKFC